LGLLVLASDLVVRALEPVLGLGMRLGLDLAGDLLALGHRFHQLLARLSLDALELRLVSRLESVGLGLAAIGLLELAGDLLPPRFEQPEQRPPCELAQQPHQQQEAEDLGDDLFRIDQVHGLGSTRARPRLTESSPRARTW